MMRVLHVKSPELFDGSIEEPVKITDCDYNEQHICDYGTCDWPDQLTIRYQTRGGMEREKFYDYFGLAEVLEALNKWDAQHDETVSEDA